MPPRPLQNLNTGRPYASNYDYQSLTPRTPHSRAGRVEEARTNPNYEAEAVAVQIETEHAMYDEQQTEPLLASSVVDDSQKSGRGKSNFSAKLSWALSRAPLALGVTAAALLLCMIVVSLKWPDALLNAIGEPASVTGDKIQDVIEPSLPPPLPSSAPDHSPNTLSYANYTKFPLSPLEYLHECNVFLAHKGRPVGGYWYTPPEGALDVVHHDAAPKTHLPEKGFDKTCSSTITYMLDGFVGLAADLALMAQVAGLAREQNRTFLVNDQYWNRGKWTDHFQNVRQRQPGPEPGCLAPPPKELVACPRVARHWVVNSRTAKFHFGHAFSDAFEDPYARSLRRLKPIYKMALDSLSQTIRPNAHNAALIRAARTELASGLSFAPGEKLAPEVYIGVHIRRGDRNAETWPHRGAYVPFEDYARTAQETWDRVAPLSTLNDSAMHSTTTPAIWLATDSPAANLDFGGLTVEGAKLFSLERSQNPELNKIASKQEYVQHEFDQLGYDERVDATRGAIVDFAMVSGAWVWHDDVRPMGTVCTISSNICKLSAVGFGWDRAFGFDGDTAGEMDGINNARKRWVEIDNAGSVVPTWRGFEMF